MPKKKKQINQKIYRVTVSKSFEYPSAVIDEGNFLRDLHMKSTEDFLNGIVKGKVHWSTLDCTLESELPFRIRNSKDLEREKLARRTSEGVEMDFIIQELALRDLEDKYGPLDTEKNPKIFDMDKHRLLGVEYGDDEDEDHDDNDEDREEEEETEEERIDEARERAHRIRRQIPYFLQPEPQQFYLGRTKVYYAFFRARILENI